jgi:hypothetical protein
MATKEVRQLIYFEPSSFLLLDPRSETRDGKKSKSVVEKDSVADP